jgi:hypothetical protein
LRGLEENSPGSCLGCEEAIWALCERIFDDGTKRPAPMHEEEDPIYCADCRRLVDKIPIWFVDRIMADADAADDLQGEGGGIG